MPNKIFIVLPAYNEEAAIGALIESITQVCNKVNLDFVIFVIDDGSTDSTREIVSKYAERFPVKLECHTVNMNLGATINDGLRVAADQAKPDDIIIALDADGTHPPSLIPEMVKQVNSGYDVVIASRYRKGAKVIGVPIVRQLLSTAAALIFKFTHPIKNVRDYTCGYRAYRASVVKKAFETWGDSFVEQSGFQCMAEILLKLNKLSISFNEIPLVLRYDLKGGVSKMRVLSTVFSSLTLIFKIKSKERKL